jgi:pSer/pThr/pTyr-binding forkhead associated (FHA) protein
MNYKFVLVNTATGQNERQWILSPPLTVGRCPTVEITINDASISRRHCQFLIDPYDSLIVRDLGSKNGVFLDDERVDKAVVSHGSLIRIGSITLRAELTDEEMVDNPEVEEIFDLGETQPMKIIRPDGSSEFDRYDIG